MGYKLKIVGKTDMGLKRTNNEDSFFVDDALGLMIVADGMGGHASGEVASQLAIKICSDQIKRSLQTGHVPVFNHVPKNPAFDSRTLLLGDCVKFSNNAVFEAAQSNEKMKNMGTTMVAALWLDQKLAVAHVGDSRLYMVRDGDMVQCTADHSFVQEQIDRGLMKPEDAEKSDLKNMLTRSVGISEDVDVDVTEIDLHENDYILLCSDGLTKMLDEDKIATAFKMGRKPEEIADELIEQAKQAGGADNITVVVAKVDGSSKSWSAISSRIKHIFKKTPEN